MSRDNHPPRGEHRPRPSRRTRARGREEQIPESEIGPLGMGQAPVKDPLKSFNGMVIASSLTMDCLLYTSPSSRDVEESRMPSSA